MFRRPCFSLIGNTKIKPLSAPTFTAMTTTSTMSTTSRFVPTPMNHRPFSTATIPPPTAPLTKTLSTPTPTTNNTAQTTTVFSALAFCFFGTIYSSRLASQTQAENVQLKDQIDSLNEQIASLNKKSDALYAYFKEISQWLAHFTKHRGEKQPHGPKMISRDIKDGNEDIKGDFHIRRRHRRGGGTGGDDDDDNNTTTTTTTTTTNNNNNYDDGDRDDDSGRRRRRRHHPHHGPSSPNYANITDDEKFKRRLERMEQRRANWKTVPDQQQDGDDDRRRRHHRRRRRRNNDETNNNDSENNTDSDNNYQQQNI